MKQLGRQKGSLEERLIENRVTQAALKDWTTKGRLCFWLPQNPRDPEPEGRFKRLIP